MRVYQLADEYKVTSKEIIETLKSNGEEVTSHLSGLTNDQITMLGYVMKSGDTIVESEYKEELAEDDDYDEKGPIDFDEQAAEENGTELSMEPEKEKDAWTLSGDTVMEVADGVSISSEEVQEALATNIKSSAEAREKYADTVKAIAEDPDNWSNLSKTEEVTDDNEDLSFGQRAFAKAEEEETTTKKPVEIPEVIVEKPKGVWGWFTNLFS